MKQIIYIGAILFLASCTKLQPKIYSNLTSDNAYSTKSDIEAALTGLYANVDGSGGYNKYYNGYQVMTTDYGSDMGFSTAGGDPTAMSTFTYNENNSYITANWQWPYKLIANANLLLSKIESSQISDQDKKLIIGQARFLRALAYRDLTDAFGAIPLFTELMDPRQTNNATLSPVTRIDSLIIEDCKFAIDNLPETRDVASGLMKATKGAALTLLGKLYMRQHDYANAKIYIDQVLALRDKGIYRLNPDFKNVWSGNNPIDKGMIFGVLHDYILNPGLAADHFGPSDNRDAPGRWAYYAVSLYFYRKYDDADPRKKFFWYNYEGNSARDGSTQHGFYYMLPAPGQTVPPNDTTKLLPDVTTKKYTYEILHNAYYDSRTVIIFRLSDVILCKAEIENSLNGPGAALTFLNEVRARAGAPQYGGDPRFPVPSSKDQMASIILDERGFELVSEFQRRPDLIRFDKFEEISNKYIQYMGLPMVITKDMKYFPYPLVDAELNSFMQSANPARIPK